MNDTLNNPWCKYSLKTGILTDVSFVGLPTLYISEGWGELEYDVALDFINGTKILSQYVVVFEHMTLINANGALCTVAHIESVYHTRQPDNCWELHDAESSDSLVSVYDKTSNGFSIESDRDMFVYITRKNDPNYLLQTLNVLNLNNTAKHITVDVDCEYSIFVSYYAT